MKVLALFDQATWTGEISGEIQALATDLLEAGRVLYFPQLNFTLSPSEGRFLTPAVADGKSKNISYDSRSGMVKGSGCVGVELSELTTMLSRFSEAACSFIYNLVPAYRDTLQRGLATFRPFEVKGRVTSIKKDDARLHVDAFASRPNHGMRLLRVFTNINPRSEPRVWQVGEPFEVFAAKFLPRVSRQIPGSAWLLHRAGVTKSRRSAYDHVMLQLHDRGKKDAEYQATAPRSTIEFPAGATWVMFSDQVLHAALAGQYTLEQTFYLPVAGMSNPVRSPLKVLERLCGRSLV